MIYNVNPVGVVSFALAAGLSISAFFGLLGDTLAPFSPLIALAVAFVMTPVMGIATRGRYYIKQRDDGIAEPRYDAQGNASITVYRCLSCREEYERPDVMHSHKHRGRFARCVEYGISREGRPTGRRPVNSRNYAAGSSASGQRGRTVTPSSAFAPERRRTIPA